MLAEKEALRLQKESEKLAKLKEKEKKTQAKDANSGAKSKEESKVAKSATVLVNDEVQKDVCMDFVIDIPKCVPTEAEKIVEKKK